MSEVKHTPGPFTAEVERFCDLASVISADGFCICDIDGVQIKRDIPSGVHWGSKPEYSREIEKDEMDRLANLFAAGPDMLAALKLAEDHFASSENCGVCHPIGDCPTLRVIRTAIKKAEGRS